MHVQRSDRSYRNDGFQEDQYYTMPYDNFAYNPMATRGHSYRSGAYENPEYGMAYPYMEDKLYFKAPHST